MPTEYERNLEAKRKDEERQRQWLAFKLSDRAPMGQINPYIQAYQMLQGRGGGGGGQGDPGISALGRGFPGSSGLIKEKQQRQVPEAEFAAKYEDTPEGLLGGLEAYKTKYPTINPYEELRERYKAESEARISAVKSRGVSPEEKAQKDNYARLGLMANLAEKAIETKAPNSPAKLDAQRAHIRILNEMAKIIGLPPQPLPMPPERPGSEWFSWGEDDPQVKYDRLWKGWKGPPEEKVAPKPIRRIVKEGARSRIGLFDAGTKKFIEWEK